MKKSITVDGHAYPIEVPTECPICHHSGETKILASSSQPNHKNVQVAFQCAYSGCKCYFIGYYPPKPQGALQELKPYTPKKTALSSEISNVSPSFVTIYGQAQEVQSLGYDQIAGPGYRKAFEFLVKDYAKQRHSDKASEIEQAFSGNVVRDYMQDARIQSLAKRALWLGNDETHYLKKWTAHDINDLVALIQLTIHWIEMERLSETYLGQMPNESKS